MLAGDHLPPVQANCRQVSNRFQKQIFANSYNHSTIVLRKQVAEIAKRNSGKYRTTAGLLDRWPLTTHGQAPGALDKEHCGCCPQFEWIETLRCHNCEQVRSIFTMTIRRSSEIIGAQGQQALPKIALIRGCSTPPPPGPRRCLHHA